MVTVTVITPADSHDLTSIEAVKLELGITDTTEDEKLRAWIHQASGAIEDYCSRVFALEEVIETFRTPEFGVEQWLSLSRSPVSEIVSVTENDVLLTASDHYEVDGDAFLWRVSSNYLTPWASLGRVSVQYIGGYSLLDDLPYGVERACLQLIKTYRSRAGRDPMLRSEEIPGVQRFDYQVQPTGDDGGIPPDVTSLLRPYVRIGV
jgi:hypothetical protein